jgi:hypothetical protein
VGIDSDHRTCHRQRGKHVAVVAENRGTWVVGVRPIGHPLQAERAVEAVEVRDPGQEPVGMLAHEVAHRPALEFDDRGRERTLASGARAFASQLTERAVDDGQCLGGRSHELGQRGQQVKRRPATRNLETSAAILQCGQAFACGVGNSRRARCGFRSDQARTGTFAATSGEDFSPDSPSRQQRGYPTLHHFYR